MKLSVLFSVFVFVAFSFFVMLHVKTDVQTLRQERQDLLNQRADLKEQMRVLQAEYAHLTRPERLAAFSQAYGLNEIRTEQMMPMMVSLKEGR